MQPIEPPHDREIGVRRRPRQIIHAAAADAQSVRLSRDRQIVRAVDHRFALSNPALVSAPSKKSFSSVSSPILACNAFMSTAGSVALPPPASKTSAAPPSSCVFHWVIWFGCTSNCSASCTIVRSPLIAASATLALNAGEWFRRGRLFIVAPDSPTLACPLSGRNSPYRPVKNFGAGSEIGGASEDNAPIQLTRGRCSNGPQGGCP